MHDIDRIAACRRRALLDARACSGRAILPVFTADAGLDSRGASS